MPCVGRVIDDCNRLVRSGLTDAADFGSSAEVVGSVKNILKNSLRDSSVKKD
jgi:hypothetical protein